MQVTQSSVTKLTITDVPGLDTITAIFEDLMPKRGKVILECAGTAWSAMWSGMGEKTVAQFVGSMSEEYLANYLSNERKDIVDAESIKSGAQRHILRLRRGFVVPAVGGRERVLRIGRGELTAREAKALWDEVQLARFGDDGWAAYNLLERIFGAEWWFQLPTKPNPNYLYLFRVITAVQQALQQRQQLTALA
ncbi:hypothetical protein [Duganella vulcania]|uniref:Uncharacterized protein n=1 Tax=Duganella vulcania TaxID=2692166 RepID=A0A845GI54_9BURK|nr:hypothetical protein [Duganella vulcania]MYM92447.1 hypothetical protein [Duganella vulcania]